MLASAVFRFRLKGNDSLQKVLILLLQHSQGFDVPQALTVDERSFFLARGPELRKEPRGRSEQYGADTLRGFVLLEVDHWIPRWWPCHSSLDRAGLRDRRRCSALEDRFVPGPGLGVEDVPGAAVSYPA
jgi:hypothetical protein